MAIDWAALAGKAGKAIDVFGNLTGNRLPEFNISERLESYGGTYGTQPTSTTQSTQPNFSQQLFSPVRGTFSKTGSVLGASDQAPGPAPGPAPDPVQQDTGPSQVDIERDRLRAELEGGHDSYISSLDEMIGSLPDIRTAQEGIVGSQFDQGIEDLGTEKELGLTDLGQQRTRTESNQTKNLADLSENIRNLFASGQVKLGALGAGDSSAVNQYSYALSKLGSKARGDQMSKTADILSQIDDREFKLNTITSNEKGRLGRERDQKMLQITQWFEEQTLSLKGARGQALKEKGQDLAGVTQGILDQAIRATEQAQTVYLNRESALVEWAINQSNSIGEVRKNIASVASLQPNLPGGSNINANISGGSAASFGGPPTGFGFSDEEEV